MVPSLGPSHRAESNPERVAPNRTQSALTGAEPVRDVKRTTSDSLAKMAKVSEQAAATGGARSSDKREDRLIEWQVEKFTRLLKKVVAARERSSSNALKMTEPNSRTKDEEPLSLSTPLHTAGRYQGSRMASIAEGSPVGIVAPSRQPSFRAPVRQPSLDKVIKASDWIIMDEVAEVITLPKFNPRAFKAIENSETISLSEAVASQLKDYIKTIAKMYRSNPLHNFEHASHVTMSANKLLNRIVIPENVGYERESNVIASDLHDYTYGITLDPLRQFAVIFSALVHDVDHTGVPNDQLAKENPELEAMYRYRSVAEQNSVDLAPELLLDSRYQDLKDCIAATEEEKTRFRQLVVVVCVLFSPKLRELREMRL